VRAAPPGWPGTPRGTPWPAGVTSCSNACWGPSPAGAPMGANPCSGVSHGRAGLRTYVAVALAGVAPDVPINVLAARGAVHAETKGKGGVRACAPSPLHTRSAPHPRRGCTPGAPGRAQPEHPREGWGQNQGWWGPAAMPRRGTPERGPLTAPATHLTCSWV